MLSTTLAKYYQCLSKIFLLPLISKLENDRKKKIGNSQTKYIILINKIRCSVSLDQGNAKFKNHFLCLLWEKNTKNDNVLCW